MNKIRLAIIPGILAVSVGLLLLANLVFGQFSVAYADSKDFLERTLDDQAPELAGQETICTLSLQYPQNIQRWCPLIEKYADQNDLQPEVVAAVILQESGGDPAAYSASGAVGLMQVMPRDGIAADFLCSNGPCFASRPSMQELFDPDFNIAYGTRLLAGLLARTGDLRQALMAYGPFDAGDSYAEKVLAIMENH